MRLLDRYIARQFVLNVVVLFVILFCFVVTVDVSINLRKFAKAASEISGDETTGVRQAVVTTLVIIDLWWPRLIQLFNYLLGLVMVGAMGFTCVQLLRNREFLAMVSAGQSLQRVLRPFIVAGIGLSIVQLRESGTPCPPDRPETAPPAPRGGAADLERLESAADPRRDGPAAVRIIIRPHERHAAGRVHPRDRRGRARGRRRARPRPPGTTARGCSPTRSPRPGCWNPPNSPRRRPGSRPTSTRRCCA